MKITAKGFPAEQNFFILYSLMVYSFAQHQQRSRVSSSSFLFVLMLVKAVRHFSV
jgi:hypothetical protein